MAALPAILPSSARIYLTPLGGAGRAFSPPVGADSFSQLHVTWREPGQPGQHCVVARDALGDWCAHQHEAVRSRIETHLAALAAPRSPIAGLSFDRPRLMGVINVTPDSFSDGGRFFDAAAAIAEGHRHNEDGADIIDIGGESTRPGAEPVTAAEEVRRVIPVIEGLRRLPVPISIDTRRAPVMRAALAAGARIVNDVSALSYDPESLAVVAESGVPVVLMHSRGDPRTMQVAPTYVDCVYDIFDYLESRIAACREAGIAKSRLVIDPGIGFGKTVQHNIDILRALGVYRSLGCPLLIGASRKSFIAKLSRGEPADRRLPGSLAAGLLGLAAGADIVRVHESGATRQALAVWRALTGEPINVA